MVDRELDLMEHVKELRLRLLRALLALALGMLLALPLVTPALDLLLRIAQDVQFIAVSPLKPVSVFFQIAFVLGMAIAAPFVLYQLYSFAAPALYPHERRLVLLLLPGSALLFALGFAFSLGVLVPVSLPVLRGFMPASVTATYTLDEYLKFVINLTAWIGVAFQVPLVLMLLAAFGWVRPEQLRRLRREVIFGAAMLAALITPTVDPFTMILVTGPFVLLYELGILLSWLVTRKRSTG